MTLFRVESQREKSTSVEKLWGFAVAAWFGLAVCPQVFAEQAIYQLDISSGTLGDKLSDLAKSTGHQLIFPTEKLDQPSAVRLRGLYTLESALDTLLGGSELSAVVTRHGVIVITDDAPEGNTTGEDMRISKKTVLTGASAVVSGMLGTDATAQEVAEDTGAEREIEVIVVTGFRESLVSALATKRNANSIVDSISSEGIGRFPDLNLGESLQRITGVQIERGERRRAEIAIRGLPRNFALTRINGQAMGSPDLTTAFPFGVFESSIFNGVDVIKTPTVEMDDGGLSGIVNMRTRRPLASGRDSFSFGIGTSYETLNEEFSPTARAGGNMRFSDNLAGSFAIGWSNQEFQRDLAAVTDYDPDGNDIQVADDFRYRSDTSDGDRVSATAALEWQATDAWNFGITSVYTGYDQSTVRDQVRIRNCSDTAVDIIGNAAVVSTHTGCRMEAETRERKDFDSTYSVTLDGTWDSGPWLAEGFLHYTRGDHDGNLIQMRRRINGIPETFTVNTGAGRPDNFGIDLGGFAAGEVATWSFATADVQTRFFPSGANDENSDTELAFQFDLTRELDYGLLSSIKAGAKYRDRSQRRVDQDAVNDDVDLGVLDDSIFRPSLVADSNFFGGNLDAFPLVVPDVFAVLDRVLPLDTDQPLNDEGFVLDQDFLATYDTQQDITAGYVMANFDSYEYDWPLQISGNVGLRFVRTERTTDTFQDIDGVISRISVPFDFNNTLPAANLVFEFTDDLLLRLSYAETIVRPNPNQFEAGTEVTVDEDGGVLESVTVEYNNPEIEPFESDSFDVSFEWYNRPGSAFTLAYFHKKVASDIITRNFCPGSLADFERADAFDQFVTGNLNGDIDDCLDDAGVQFTITDVVNSSETFSLDGLEFGLLQNLDFLPPPFDGLGVQANYTFIDADESGQLDEDGTPAPLEEVSEHTVNVIGYYETDRWGIRLAYNYRSEYFTTADRGPSGGNRSIDDRDQFDLSFNFNFNDNISVGFEALNLNDAEVYEFEGDRNRLRSYNYDGRTFVLTSTVSF